MNNYKNRIKKFLTYIVCIVSLISLYACNNINSLDDSEFIIIDNNNIYGIEKKDNKFVVNSSQKREKGDFELWYYNNIFFENKDIALVILDVMMPGTTGYAACAEIRKQSADIDPDRCRYFRSSEECRFAPVLLLHRHSSGGA